MSKNKKGRGRSRQEIGSFEYTALITVTLILLAFGTVMVFSASWARAYFNENQDSLYYLKREAIFGLAGLGLMITMARTNFLKLRKIAPALMIAILVLLLVVFLPGLGVSAKGAKRWIGFGMASFQPSELAKLATILYVATIMYKRPMLLKNLKSMALPLLGLPALACLLILAEPDMGTTIAIVTTVVSMLVVGGMRRRDLAIMGSSLVVLALALGVMAPYRMARLTAFLDPWKDAHESGFQIIQSLVAIGSGGLLGVGLGKSIQKFNYLPEAHTDMILSIIGEELGLIGIVFVVLLYAFLAFIGFRIAVKSRNLFGKYVAAGITSLLVSQAAINLCAVMGLVPLTGIPLPMISYGGSSLVVILASIGILLNIAINPRNKIAVAPERKIKVNESGDRSRRHGRAPGARSRSGRRAHG